jgi:hypothetical protein
MKISVGDAKEIFKSIKSACDVQDIKKATVGDLSWKTDARKRSTDDERMAIQFHMPMGSTSATVSRDQVVTALAEFETKFGLD